MGATRQKRLEPFKVSGLQLCLEGDGTFVKPYLQLLQIVSHSQIPNHKEQ